ncbi:uncharacterized protein SAPINGB_P003140 [Magnusiomyces paraingens]|uniref:Glycosyl hydrolase family 76 n=1 Tax=Magnusiomyces paraingens TaxID=2606893 RepID=A0A5E8BJ15_9ASCO|nr:uncharacterized protein SAPINGB_P003140 [Saprochaete ingens]VVT51570.1 unnamed protein product [Saprochaete ingens]
MTIDLNQQGMETLRLTWNTFWDKHCHGFRNKNKSDGSYTDDGKYTVWPLSVLAQAVVDAMRIYPQDAHQFVEPVFRVFDRYYSPKYHAYCASENFDGNNDVYFDDNAQVASAFLTAFEVTGNRHYLDKGAEVVRFLLTGWYTSEPYGVRWHVEKDGSNTCTTAECGIAALRLERHMDPNDSYARTLVSFASDCARWVFDRMQDQDDKLIRDGYVPDKEHNECGNGYRIDGMKWTYNQGTPLTLTSMLYCKTGQDWFKEKAEQLALAVTDTNTTIFDRDTPNHDARFYRDSLYFYQLLAEGFADLHLFIGQRASQEVLDRTRREAIRVVKYMNRYMRNNETGLYFQTFEIFRISEQGQREYHQLTGTDKKYEPSEGERCHDNHVPVCDRKLTHSLISCASAARIYFQTARLSPSVD